MLTKKRATGATPQRSAPARGTAEEDKGMSDQQTNENTLQAASVPGNTLPLRLIFVVAVVSLLISAALRIALTSIFGSPLGVSLTAIPGMLLRGFLNDLVVIPGFLVPVAAVALLTPRRLRHGLIGRLLMTLTFVGTVFGLTYLAFVEYFFFEEFTSRFNLVAVDYLVSPTEVFVNIWDSYPVARVLLITAVAAVAVAFASRRMIKADLQSTAPARSRVAAFLLLLALAVTLPSIAPVNLVSSGSRFRDEVSANGIHSFFEALRTNDIDYSKYYRMLPEASAFKLVRHDLINEGGTWASSQLTDLRRSHPRNGSPFAGRNVVVLVQESLGCEHVGACGDSRGLTPNIDGLAKEGIFWSNAWATGTRTVRGLEAVVTSFPPIPSKSIVKRPGSEGIATWGRVMSDAGYETSFLYGGYGTFDNMNHFFASNGFEISDRTDIDNPVFANIWGVSDEDLFRHALEWFDTRSTESRPFFSIVLSTSNHKPFTFREGVPGVPAEGGGRPAGVRYADFAVGKFIKEARKRPWYDNTIFVLLGDHGSRVYGHGEIPLPTYRIPVLIFGEGIEPQVLSTPASQIDVAPTILGLLGIPYTAPFYGCDVLSDPDPDRPIYVSHNHDVGMLVGDRLAVLGLQKTSSVYHYDFRTDTQTAIPYDRDLIDRATASYESAFLLFSRGQYR